MGVHPSHLIVSTTMQAYQTILRNGLLKKAQLEVYIAVYNSPYPVTAGEITKQLMKTPQMHPKYHPALHALWKRGVVSKVGRRPCTVTNYMAQTYKVNPHLPTALPKKKRVRPTDAELEEALETFDVFDDFYTQLGLSRSDAFEKVLEWLHAGAPPR